MAFRSDPELLVLQAVRVRSIASTGDVAVAAGLAVDEARTMLDRMAADGLVRAHGGALAGWGLTPSGRGAGAALLATELDVSGARDVVEQAYSAFRAVNPELLAACTDWQLVAGADGLVVNDHQDPVHDAAAVRRLTAVDDAVQPVLADLAAVLARFEGYAPRLRNALDRVRSGSEDWFDKPTIDSYHTVWFELHEDLLATLGLTRADEAEEE